MLEKYRKTMTVEVLHSWAADAQAEIDALRKDAEHYRWWRKTHETTLVTAMFGNGCINKTIEMAEERVDAVLSLGAG